MIANALLYSLVLRQISFLIDQGFKGAIVRIRENLPRGKRNPRAISSQGLLRVFPVEILLFASHIPQHRESNNVQSRKGKYDNKLFCFLKTECTTQLNYINTLLCLISRSTLLLKGHLYDKRRNL